MNGKVESNQMSTTSSSALLPSLANGNPVQLHSPALSTNQKPASRLKKPLSPSKVQGTEEKENPCIAIMEGGEQSIQIRVCIGGESPALGKEKEKEVAELVNQYDYMLGNLLHNIDNLQPAPRSPSAEGSSTPRSKFPVMNLPRDETCL